MEQSLHKQMDVIAVDGFVVVHVGHVVGAGGVGRVCQKQIDESRKIADADYAVAVSIAILATVISHNDAARRHIENGELTNICAIVDPSRRSHEGAAGPDVIRQQVVADKLVLIVTKDHLRELVLKARNEDMAVLRTNGDIETIRDFSRINDGLASRNENGSLLLEF